MNKTELAKQYALFIAGLFFTALGVALTKRGELGVSPTSSVANVMNLKFPSISMGNWLIVWNCVLIVGQIAILRKSFQLIQLLQIPLSFLFGWFTDFWVRIADIIPADTYWVRLIMVMIGVVIIGFGVSLTVIANVILNSAEAFVKAVSDTAKKEFGNVKIAFDIMCVIISVALSLVFFDFTIVGTREGTVIAALFTGVAVKLFTKMLKNPLERILQNKAKE